VSGRGTAPHAAIASNQTITGAHTFNTGPTALDGSAEDDDGMVNGTFTVNGNLTMDPGSSITCNDPASPPNDSACNITIVVGGNFVMQTGSLIQAENQTSGGTGAKTTITVAGDMTMQGTAAISSSDTVGGGSGGGAGDITITVGNASATPPTGVFTMQTGSSIKANGPNSVGGVITIHSGHSADIDGLVESAVDSGLTGTGSTQGLDGNSIDITAGCQLTISTTGEVSSRGQDAGANLVHLQGCDVQIFGLVESIANGGHATPNSPANKCDGATDQGILRTRPDASRSGARTS
jgi:hypothetical protein